MEYLEAMWDVGLTGGTMIQQKKRQQLPQHLQDIYKETGKRHFTENLCSNTIHRQDTQQIGSSWQGSYCPATEAFILT